MSEDVMDDPDVVIARINEAYLHYFQRMTGELK